MSGDASLREHIVDFLTDRAATTANEIIEGVLSAGAKSAEVRTTLAVLRKLGKVRLVGRVKAASGHGEENVYELGTEDHLAKVLDGPAKPDLKGQVEFLSNALKAAGEQHEFLVLRNQRLKDLIRRMAPLLGTPDPHLAREVRLVVESEDAATVVTNA